MSECISTAKQVVKKLCLIGVTFLHETAGLTVVIKAQNPGSVLGYPRCNDIKCDAKVPVMLRKCPR